MNDDILTIPVEMTLTVWGEKVDYISVRTDDPSLEDNDEFWAGEFRRQLAAAVKLLGKDITLDYLSALTLNFIGSRVWYDYIFEAGKLIGNFDVHLRGTPDGKIEFVEMT